MAVPGGSEIQRRLVAPSVQSGYWGAKASRSRGDLPPVEVGVEAAVAQRCRRIGGRRLRRRRRSDRERCRQDRGGQSS